MRLLSLLTRKGRYRLRRYLDVFSTLITHGFGEIVYRSGLGTALRVTRRLTRLRRPVHGRAFGASTTWERVRMVVEELGPTFVKFGQILSNRPDLIPPELQFELQKLLENAPPFSAREASSVLKEEFGKPIRGLFAEFDRVPLAAASIAQVHRAVLLSGEIVAVKIQRPGLRELIDVDIEILMEIARRIERYVKASRTVGSRRIVAEFEKSIHQELDFGREAASIERFARQFAEDPRVRVPRVFHSHSTRRVLTMEFIQGRPLADLIAGDPPDTVEAARVARLGADLTLTQVFVHGFFHADPHPGNIVILEDGRLCYLDFGLTGSLVQRDLQLVSDLLIGLIRQNEQSVARAVVRLAGSRDFDTARSIERDLAELIGGFHNAEAGDFPFTMLLSQIVAILVHEGLRLPPDLYLLVKALITIEGVATALDPHFGFAKQIEPFARTLVRDRYDPARLASRLGTSVGDFAELLEFLPGDYQKVVETLTSGRLRLTVDDATITPIRKTFLQATSALVFAVVLGSLIIGSALIVHSQVPPLWHGVPVIGIVGFVAAGMIGFGLLVRIIRNGAM